VAITRYWSVCLACAWQPLDLNQAIRPPTPYHSSIPLPTSLCPYPNHTMIPSPCIHWCFACPLLSSLALDLILSRLVHACSFLPLPLFCPDPVPSFLPSSPGPLVHLRIHPTCFHWCLLAPSSLALVLISSCLDHAYCFLPLSSFYPEPAPSLLLRFVCVVVALLRSSGPSVLTISWICLADSDLCLYMSLILIECAAPNNISQYLRSKPSF
jgi:hypothetical protein